MQVMYDDLYKSLFEIVSFFDRPRQDKLLTRKTGITLDRALFLLLMRIAHHGSLGIVELANQVDKDHSTVSRQVDKLVDLELVTSGYGRDDKRVRKISLSPTGKALVSKIAVTRGAMMREALKDWSGQELTELQSSLKHLAMTIHTYSKS